MGRTRIGWALATVVFLALAACRTEDRSDTYAGTIEFADVQVGSLVGGRVESVARREGEEAKANEVLVSLSRSEWQTTLDEASALAQATARELDLLRAGPRPEEIAQAKAEAKRLELLWTVSSQGARPEDVEAARSQVTAAAAAANEAEKEVDRLAPLVHAGREPASRLDRATADRDAAVAQRSVAEQRLQLLERGLRPEEIEAARQAWIAQQERVKALESGARPEELAAKQSTLDAAQARIRFAEAKLRELSITAPADCFVQTLDVRPGDLIKAGDPVAVLLLREPPTITIYVPEEHLARVRLGGEAEVVPDGSDARPGRVTWISRRAEYSPRNVQTQGERVTQVFPVKVEIGGDASLLKDGMWADVRLK